MSILGNCTHKTICWTMNIFITKADIPKIFKPRKYHAFDFLKWGTIFHMLGVFFSYWVLRYIEKAILHYLCQRRAWPCSLLLCVHVWLSKWILQNIWKIQQSKYETTSNQRSMLNFSFDPSFYICISEFTIQFTAWIV